MLGQARLFEKLIFESWAIALFLIIGYALYEKADADYREEYTKLYEILTNLQTEQQLEKVRREDLTLQIESQSDHYYQELLLMRGLGLVPEGQTKIYFAPRAN